MFLVVVLFCCQQPPLHHPSRSRSDRPRSVVCFSFFLMLPPFPPLLFHSLSLLVSIFSSRLSPVCSFWLLFCSGFRILFSFSTFSSSCHCCGESLANSASLWLDWWSFWFTRARMDVEANDFLVSANRGGFLWWHSKRLSSSSGQSVFPFPFSAFVPPFPFVSILSILLLSSALFRFTASQMKTICHGW